MLGLVFLTFFSSLLDSCFPLLSTYSQIPLNGLAGSHRSSLVSPVPQDQRREACKAGLLGALFSQRLLSTSLSLLPECPTAAVAAATAVAWAQSKYQLCWLSLGLGLGPGPSVAGDVQLPVHQRERARGRCNAPGISGP